MKKLLSVILSLTFVILCFGGCNSTAKENKVYKIGIIQYISHSSLDNCYNGIVSAFKDVKNVEFDRQIGSDASAGSDCAAFAENMVAKNYDMIIAIATPAAQSAFAAVESTNIPVIFCAVNDPVQAELVESLEKPGYNCTGTSDVLDLSAQLSLIQAMQPKAKNIGILYTTSEVNSISNLNRFKALAKECGLNIVDVGVQNDADIHSAAANLVTKVDCINNFTDNNVVKNLSVVLETANSANIPVYGSEEEQVKKGCLASASIDYVALGKVTGEMALEVKNGANPADMAVKTINEAVPIVNTDVLNSLGIMMPGEYENAQTVTTEK